MEQKIAARRIHVPGDVDIEVVYVPPIVGGPHEVPNEALAAFKEIEVNPVESAQARSVGQQASKLVGL